MPTELSTDPPLGRSTPAHAHVVSLTADFIEPFLPLLIASLNDPHRPLQLTVSTIRIGFHDCYGAGESARRARLYGEGAEQYRDWVGELAAGNNQREEEKSFWSFALPDLLTRLYELKELCPFQYITREKLRPIYHPPASFVRVETCIADRLAPPGSLTAWQMPNWVIDMRDVHPATQWIEV